jgi:rRNA maturation protein Nop10
MKDIKLLEKCPKCGEHLTLMESININTDALWLVKRCLNCYGYPVEEVIRVMDKIE